MLYGHDPKAPGVAAFTRELQGVLRSEWPETGRGYEELLDFDRLGDRERWPNFASYVARKYRGFRIDAVIAEGSTALQFAVERFDEIFPGVPIVYGIAFEPVVDFSALPANVTGRRIPLPFAETFALARRLQPDAKRVYIVTGAAEMDSTVTSQAIRDLTPLLDGMQLEVLKNWSYPSLLRTPARVAEAVVRDPVVLPKRLARASVLRRRSDTEPDARFFGAGVRHRFEVGR